MNENELEHFVKEYLVTKEKIVANHPDSGRKADYLMMQLLILWKLHKNGILGKGPSLTNGFPEGPFTIHNVRDMISEIARKTTTKGQGSPFDFWTEIDGLLISEDLLYARAGREEGHSPLLNIIIDHETCLNGYDGFFLGALFEKLLNIDERKVSGQFYTPRELTSYICKNTLSPYVVSKVNELHDLGCGTLGECLRADLAGNGVEQHIQDILSNVKILDPACGTGHFLESAFDAFMSIYDILSRSRVSGDQGEKDHELKIRAQFKAGILRSCLFGVDISKAAIKLARARLALKLYEDGPLNAELPQSNLRCGNALLGSIGTECLDNKYWEELKENRIGYRKDIEPFHWMREFPNMGKGGFDIIIGNPPYGKIKNLKMPIGEKRQLSRTYKLFYKLTGANIDTYKLFLERCLALLSPDGYLSLVIPGMFWGDKDSLGLRKAIFSRDITDILLFPLESTRELFQGKISYEVSVFIMRNSLGNGSKIRIRSNVGKGSISDLENVASTYMSLDEIRKYSSLLRIPLFKNAKYEKQIYATLGTMEKLGKYRGAMSIIVGKLDESINREYLGETPTGDMAIASNHIKDWYVDMVPRTEKKRWVRNAEAFKEKRLRKRIMGAGTVGELMLMSPKIIGRQMANRGERRKLHFALHYGSEILTNGVRTIFIGGNDERMHKSFLAILNSDIANWYFSLYSHTYNVKPYELEELPMPPLDDGTLESLGRLSDIIMFGTTMGRMGKGLPNETYFYTALMNAILYDIYLFGGKINVMAASEEYMVRIGFKKWSLLSRKGSNGRTGPDEERELMSIEDEYAQRIHDAAVLATADRCLAERLDAIFSNGKVRSIKEIVGL